MKLTEEQKNLLVDFMAYCTTRDEVAILSSEHDSLIGLELVAEYESVIEPYEFETVSSYLDFYYSQEEKLV